MMRTLKMAATFAIRPTFATVATVATLALLIVIGPAPLQAADRPHEAIFHLSPPSHRHGAECRQRRNGLPRCATITLYRA